MDESDQVRKPQVKLRPCQNQKNRQGLLLFFHYRC